MVYCSFKDDEIDHIFEELMKYPVRKVNPRKAQAISRHKKIRYINQKEKYIYIKDGVISLNPKIKVIRMGNGFDFKIF